METTTSKNVEAIARIEREALRKRSAGERLGDMIASEGGRLWFIVLHAFWFAFWIALNAGRGPRLGRFDLFPYPLLTMIVSLESIFLSLFILMSQNRSARQADQRSHLDLQINLLSEQENTKMLEMLQAICLHHGLAAGGDPEISELSARTKPAEVFDQLAQTIPTSENLDDLGK